LGETLQAFGITLPTPAYIFGAIFFGIVGLAAWRYGRTHESAPIKWMAVALMLYPYLISRTWLLFAVGIALCLAIVAAARRL
jgi:hypothetical protein